MSRRADAETSPIATKFGLSMRRQLVCAVRAASAASTNANMHVKYPAGRRAAREKNLNMRTGILPWLGAFFELHAIPAGFLRTIERLVGGFDDELGRRMPFRLLADADADADADGMIGRACVQSRAGNRLAQRLGVRRGFLGGTSLEHDEKLFAAVAERTPATADLGKFGRHGLEQLIADIVAVRVVESLEVIDVAHRDRVGAPEVSDGV